MSTPARQTLSVAIIAKNEEENLRLALPSIVSVADEIVLIDSGSTDGTIAVAESFGARVIQQEWLGFGPQKNFAISQTTCVWVLSLDSDEIVSNELAAAIPQALSIASPNTVGFVLTRRNYFLGRPMLHGGMYPDRKLRLFRRGQARFEDRPVHESMIADGSVTQLAGELHHHAYPTLSSYIEHMNRYSSACIPLVLAQGKRSLFFPAFVWNTLANPLATFMYNYVLRGGFLDGREGLLLHIYHSAYVSWKYAKAWEQMKNQKGLPGR